ncbi:MAG TPA: FG-GAP repeat protein, partial [Sumerlaeia bacterium]|nr:FG-GAP repeat protein [Sumerlaeia bacterium]
MLRSAKFRSRARARGSLPVLIAVSVAAFTLWPSPSARGDDFDIRSVFSSKLVAEGVATSDWLGQAVAISGNTAVVGAYFDDEKGDDAGAAYIFRRAGPRWTQLVKLTAGDGEMGDKYGYSVGISGDTVLIGAIEDDQKGGEAGAAYVYTDTSPAGDWSSRREVKLVASDGDDGDIFGWSVFLSGDRAIVGARDDEDLGDRGGSAYILMDTSAEGDWTSVKQVKLLPSDGRSWDHFGWSVSMRGNAALVGSYGADEGASNCGAAYLFLDESEAKDWSSIGEIKLLPVDPTKEKEFGFSVSLSARAAIVGADRDGPDGARTGAAYLFRDTSAARNWSTTSQTKIRPTALKADDAYGLSVGISGRYAVVGAYMSDDRGDASGAAYIYA